MSTDSSQNAQDNFFRDPFLEDTRKRRTHLIPIVLLGGLITSALTLALIFYISRKADTDVLSILLNFLPIPAVLLGMLAGSGYAIACRCTQFRASITLILFICLLQAGVFVGGRYMSYLCVVQQMKSIKFEDVYKQIDLTQLLKAEPKAGDKPEAAQAEVAKKDAPAAAPLKPADGEKLTPEKEKQLEELREQIAVSMMTPPSFWDYYCSCMENITMADMEKSHKDGKEDEGWNLGRGGYLFELFIMLSFCLSSTVSLWVVLLFPYCRQCARYLVKKECYYYPCRAPYVKINKKDTQGQEEFARQDAEILADTLGKFSELISWFTLSNTPQSPLTKTQVYEHIQEFYPEKRVQQNDPVMKKMPNWITIDFRECPDCENWYVLIQLQIFPSDNAGTRLKSVIFLEGGRDGLKTPVEITNDAPAEEKTDS